NPGARARVLLRAELLQWGPVSRRGGTLDDHGRMLWVEDALQWGPVSRRGGTRREPAGGLGAHGASMGPRLSTGGNPAPVIPVKPHVGASMGPRLSTGGNLW